MDISVVIPLLDEQDSLGELHEWIAKTMQSNGFSYELIFIDDGSRDQSWEIIKTLCVKNPAVFGIRFSKNFGKSQALHAGFERAVGDVVITMDADLQDSPEEIPGLFNMIKNNKCDLVSVGRKNAMTGISLKIYPLSYLIGPLEKYRESRSTILIAD
jgi:glycosyltransferase involved in cell wall biosynthesis